MCECPDGFSGERCEVPGADPCRPNPCDNGGTCSAEGDGFSCECANSPSATTRYFVSSAGNQNEDGMVGAATVEAFDEMGASMGVIPVDGAGQFDLDALFGTGDRISRFVVTANVDNHRISSMSVQPVACM